MKTKQLEAIKKRSVTVAPWLAAPNAEHYITSALQVAFRQAPADVAALLGYVEQLRGQVAGLQQELGEQEVQQLTLVQDRFEALDSLADMYHQYCPPPYGHEFMSAGEGAADVLEKHGLLPNGEFGTPAWPEPPAPAPQSQQVPGGSQAGGQEGGSRV